MIRCLPAGIAAGVLLATSMASSGAARAEEVAAFYRASWAGLPAAELRLGFGHGAGAYRDEIHIESKGLARWFTKFRCAGALRRAVRLAQAA